jgi:hypothetical protein
MTGTTAHTSEKAANNGYADLLELGMEFEFVSPERQGLMNGRDRCQNGAVAMSLIDDEPTEVEMRDAQVEPTVGQEHPKHASSDEQARRSTLDLSNTAPRPIRAPHSRHNNHYRSFKRYAQGDYYIPKPYRDPDADRGRASDHDRQHRDPSPDTVRDQGKAIYVSAMADVDVKEERDDRRDGDRYRGGGNNKRRRDGKLATGRAESVRNTDIYRWRGQLQPG